MEAGEIEKAARHAATSPKQELRTIETVRRFQAAAAPAGGGKAPILVYFARCSAAWAPSRTKKVSSCQAGGQGSRYRSGSSPRGSCSRARNSPTCCAPPRAAPAGGGCHCTDWAAARQGRLCLAEMLDVDEREACLERQPKAYSTTIMGRTAAGVVPDLAALLAAAHLAPPRALALYEKLCALPPPPPDPEDRLAVMQACTGAAAAARAADGRRCYDLPRPRRPRAGHEARARPAPPRPPPRRRRVLVDNQSANAAIGEAMLEAAAFSSYDARAVGVRAEELGRYEQALRLLTAVDDVGRASRDGVAVDACASRWARSTPPTARRGTTAIGRRLARCSRGARRRAGAPRRPRPPRPPRRLHRRRRRGAARVPLGAARTRDDPALTLEYLRACKAAGRVTSSSA